MSFPIDEKLVVAIASSALFNLTESHAVFVEQGEEAYREHQKLKEDMKLFPGVAFPFIKRLLSLNRPADLYEPIEVVLLSRNDPDTGLRVMNSIEQYGLPISRAAFVRGGDPFRYIESFNASLFLSADEKNVREAVMNGHPAGRVLASNFTDDPSDHQLRIAFDFDGVIADDQAERIYQIEGLAGFQKHEVKKALVPHNPGPLKRLVQEIGRIHQRELARAKAEKGYEPVVRIAIVTSRNAPAHKRVVTTLRAWGVGIDETFFLGGMDKNRVLSVFKPHLFFDDQMTHAGPMAGTVPSVHVPFGVKNELSDERRYAS
ncbi:MAG: 5'-nucleotidase [Candidatus Methylomirabilota bacterium]